MGMDKNALAFRIKTLKESLDSLENQILNANPPILRSLEVKKANMEEELSKLEEELTKFEI